MSTTITNPATPAEAEGYCEALAGAVPVDAVTITPEGRAVHTPAPVADGCPSWCSEHLSDGVAAGPIGPRPLLLVHQSTGPTSTACGRFAGSRRFDQGRGTFVQDSAHLSVHLGSNLTGREVCPTCLQAVGR